LSSWYGDKCRGNDVARAAMEIWEVRVDGYRVIYRLLFAEEGAPESAEGILIGNALRAIEWRFAFRGAAASPGCGSRRCA